VDSTACRWAGRCEVADGWQRTETSSRFRFISSTRHRQRLGIGSSIQSAAFSGAGAGIWDFHTAHTAPHIVHLPLPKPTSIEALAVPGNKELSPER